MKNYIFNEKRDIEAMIASNFVDTSNPVYTIRALARYNYYIKNLSDKQNYSEIHDYMTKNCDVYTEIGYSNYINGCIRDARKAVLADVDCVVITKNELETIKSINDDRCERLAFVLLADAKYDDAKRRSRNGVTYITTRDLFGLARVTMPLADRNMFLSFLYDKNLVEENLSPKFTGKKLLFMSDTDDEPELVLTENNYKELAFTYNNWKSGGYKECKLCGRLFKARKNSQYCKECTPKYEKIEFKIGKCIECGEEFEVDARNNTKCRCDACQIEERRRQKRNWASNNN